MHSINQRIAEELGVRPQQVAAAVSLLDEGSTVPFIARYRKEVTGSLDDTQLRHLEERLRYLRELDERRASILASIEEQGKLTAELAREINLADTKTRLEDLYLPYKQKRRTKGQIALEAGIGELADALFADPTLNPQEQARWEQLRAAFLVEGQGGTRTAEQMFAQIDDLSENASEQGEEILGMLYDYAESIVPEM